MSRLFRPGLLLLSAVALAAAAEETPSTEVAVGGAGGYSKGRYRSYEVLVGSTWQLGQAFKPSRADDRQLQQLDRRRDIVTADLAYNF